MAQVVFYEKPGCPGNARQKELLQRAGHSLEVRDLTTHPWRPEELMAFLGELPVADWFNRAAPRVKSGEVDPDALSPRDALPILLADPELIRRPLLESDGHREVGFLSAVVDQWLGLEPVIPASACGDGGSCGSAGGGSCEPPGRPPTGDLVTLGLGAGGR